jgi:hypothetical protein
MTETPSPAARAVTDVLDPWHDLLDLLVAGREADNDRLVDHGELVAAAAAWGSAITIAREWWERTADLRDAIKALPEMAGEPNEDGRSLVRRSDALAVLDRSTATGRGDREMKERPR